MSDAFGVSKGIPRGVGTATAMTAAYGTGAGLLYVGGKKLRRRRTKVAKALTPEQAERKASLEAKRIERQKKGAKAPGLRPLPERGAPTSRMGPEARSLTGAMGERVKNRYRADRTVARAERQAAEEAHRLANPAKSAFIHPEQISAMSTKAALAGGGAVWVARRRKARAEGRKVRGGEAVDAAIGGGSGFAAGSLAMNAGGWGAKRGSDAYRERVYRKNPERKVKADAAWNAYRKERGFTKLGVATPGDKIDVSRNSGQVKVGLRYPKEIPGWSVKRALAVKNVPAVVAGVGIGSTALGAHLALRKKERKP